MSILTDTIQKTQEATASAVSTAQELTVGAVDTFADFVSTLLPDLPVSDRLPEVKKYINQAFDYTLKMVETQRDLALRVAEALAPQSSD